MAERKTSALGPVQVKRKKLWVRMKDCRYLYLLLLPVMANFIIFHYLPYFGIQIAFKQYNLVNGVWASPWVGLENFRRFFSSYYAWPIIGNTIRISLTMLAVGFPIPILFSLLLNELRSRRYKKLVQTVSIMPYFISTVVIVSMMTTMFSMEFGIVNKALSLFGLGPYYFFGEPRYFLPLYLGLQIWRWTGFDAIIYIAAITGIDPDLYEAAAIDGAGRLRRIWHITLPGIRPTIIILFILRMGSVISVDWQTIFLMTNALNQSVTEVIQTYVYKRAFVSQDYSLATAVGLAESVIGFVMVISANWISKKLSDTYLF